MNLQGISTAMIGNSGTLFRVLVTPIDSHGVGVGGDNENGSA